MKCTGNNTSLSSTGSFDSFGHGHLGVSKSLLHISCDKVTVPVAGGTGTFSIAKNFTSDRRALSVRLQKNDATTVEEYNHYTMKYISGTTHGMLAGGGIVECH